MIIYHTYISSDTPCSWPLQQVVTGRKSAIDGRPSDCTTQQDLRAISMMGEQTNAIWCYSHLCTNFYVVFPKYPHLLCQHWEDTLRSQFRDGMKMLHTVLSSLRIPTRGKGTPLWKSSWHQKYDTTLYISPNINRSYMINVDDIVESQ